MIDLVRPLRFLWFPVLLLGGFYGLYPHLTEIALPWRQLLPWLPFLLLVLIALLGWHFHYRKALLAAVLLLLVDYSLQSPYGRETLSRSLLQALAPVSFLLLSFYRQRPLLSLQGFTSLLLVAAPLAAALCLYRYFPVEASAWLNFEPEGVTRMGIDLPYALPILLCQSLVLLTLVIRIGSHQQLSDSYLLISALLVSWLLAGSVPLMQQQLLISVNLLLWLIAVLVHSHNLAYLDELTGLPGRRALNQRMLTLGRRHCIAMLDIDHFKRFNDTYGHDVGDQVLKLVAAKLRQVRGGTAYRYGGEEFCILFPGSSREQARPALEEIRLSIEAARLQLRSQQRPKSNQQGRKLRGQGGQKTAGKAVSVTISIGVAERQAKRNTLKQADKALYKAKKQGRNCICY